MILLRSTRSYIPVLLIGVLLLGCAKYQENNMYNGFELIEKKFVKEVNSECLHFKHEKTGARLFKIASDDANKTFSIAFKTLPESDAGTPHILEHSVLNGSKNFPVKSPFDVLAKGSLNTFLNAMTGGDMTIYPIASMNEKDYFNLMHIYLDAVFFPLIYEDPRILQQEGWHHELIAADQPVVYKGVVYNEMKGAFSSPTRELGYLIDKHLFPDNSYRFSSGGYPTAIPSLTYEAFIEFHRTYYHPSNSYIFLYGNADLEKELEFINTEYLSKFDAAHKKIEMGLQKPFDKMKKISAYYSAAENGSTSDQTYLSLSFVAGLNTDPILILALRILQDVLVDQESAPIRLALQEAEIGKDVQAYLDEMKQNVFQIRVQNANPEDSGRFHSTVIKVLDEIAKNGVDKSAVEGTLNRIEFRLREPNDAQKGLASNFEILSRWFFENDPFTGLEYEQALQNIRKLIPEGYLEEVIKKYVLENNHSLLLTLEPKTGREKEINDQTIATLAKFKSTLSREEKEQLIKHTTELIEYQKREDEPEALATIPLLNLSDINPEAEWYDISELSVNGTKVLHHETFANDIIYLRLFYDLHVLPKGNIPYAALLSEVLSTLNTKNYSYGELDKALNYYTGGFSTFTDVYLEENSDNNLLPMFIINTRSMKSKMDKMFELTTEVIHNTIYDNSERLKEVMVRHQSQLDASLKRNGLGYARTRMTSYLSKHGQFNELTEGYEYYKFITDLTRRFDESSSEIIENLTETASLLFSKDNLIVGMTGSNKDLIEFKSNLKGFLNNHPSVDTKFTDWNFTHTTNNEGLLTASKVQYVLQGFDFKKQGYEWNGKMRVLNQILSRDWLTKQLRVIGGAYGGFSSFSPSGIAYFGSYRDPNLRETLKNYQGTDDYLHTFEADSQDMTRYIIGTIARLDRPRTPMQQGIIAFRNHFEKSSKEILQKERNDILNTTAEDIKNMQSLISDLIEKNIYCVYGNETKMKKNEDLFNSLIQID